MQTGLPFFRLLHITTLLPALAPVSNVSESMRGAQDPESDSRELLDEVRGWPGGKGMGTVTHVSTQNRNRWWEVSCLFSSLKTRAKAVGREKCSYVLINIFKWSKVFDRST